MTAIGAKSGMEIWPLYRFLRAFGHKMAKIGPFSLKIGCPSIKT